MARQMTTFSTYHARVSRTMIVSSVLWFLVPSAAAVTSLGIEGWRPLDLTGDVPLPRLGDDPVLGRLVCPPVSRVDLRAGKTDPLLVRDVEVTTRDDLGPVWKYEVRSGLYWWGGDAVTGADLAKFLRNRLQDIVAKMPLSPAAVPPFDITTDGYEVSVRWQKPPEFGPYVLNGKPLWRPQPAGHAGDIRYECVGTYAPKKRKNGYDLVPTKGYGGSPTPLFVGELNKPDQEAIRFRPAGSFASNPWTRLSDTPLECSQSIQQPLFTVIVWNLKAVPTDAAEFRKILTGLTPRGALLRAGAGYLGTLVSAPIPRSHPGYNKSLPVREFDLVKASEALTKLGFKREKPNTPRLTPEGEPLVLKIQTETAQDGLLEKVLADSFASVGIAVEYVRGKPGYPHVHGVLTGLWVDWPHVDFLPYLTTDAHPGYPLFPLSDPELEKAMRAYSASLTQSEPDFALLQKVHERLYALEPFTVLMQHEVCLDVRKTWEAKAKKIDILDPDWFRSLVR